MNKATAEPKKISDREMVKLYLNYRKTTCASIPMKLGVFARDYYKRASK